MSPKLVMGQEVAGGSEPSPSGQWRSSRQVAAQPAIINGEEPAKELEGDGAQGKIPRPHQKVANQAPQPQS